MDSVCLFLRWFMDYWALAVTIDAVSDFFLPRPRTLVDDWWDVHRIQVACCFLVILLGRCQSVAEPGHNVASSLGSLDENEVFEPRALEGLLSMYRGTRPQPDDSAVLVIPLEPRLALYSRAISMTSETREDRSVPTL